MNVERLVLTLWLLKTEYSYVDLEAAAETIDGPFGDRVMRVIRKVTTKVQAQKAQRENRGRPPVDGNSPIDGYFPKPSEAKAKAKAKAKSKLEPEAPKGVASGKNTAKKAAPSVGTPEEEEGTSQFPLAPEFQGLGYIQMSTRRLDAKGRKAFLTPLPEVYSHPTEPPIYYDGTPVSFLPPTEKSPERDRFFITQSRGALGGRPRSASMSVSIATTYHAIKQGNWVAIFVDGDDQNFQADNIQWAERGSDVAHKLSAARLGERPRKK